MYQEIALYFDFTVNTFAERHEIKAIYFFKKEMVPDDTLLLISYDCNIRFGVANVDVQSLRLKSLTLHTSPFTLMS